ncbi:MAG: hypothetical protein ACJAYC_001219 [Halieaceae bacterium]|jgi:hypothetical protein
MQARAHVTVAKNKLVSSVVSPPLIKQLFAISRRVGYTIAGDLRATSCKWRFSGTIDISRAGAVCNWRSLRVLSINKCVRYGDG